MKHFEYGPCGLNYKSFMIIIYDHYDNGLYYKTTIAANLTKIVANLPLARSVNYDHKVHCKLKHTFMIINYNHKPFIVQATGLFQRNESMAKHTDTDELASQNGLFSIFFC
jgi:hypothetical protein